MLELFIKGGPIMWPLLLTSLVAVSVVFERCIFLMRERSRRQPDAVEAVLSLVEQGHAQEAVQAGNASSDFVARSLAYGIEHHGKSLVNALTRAASRELVRYNRGLATLDTIITLAPLLGLLGTVTGMIRAFGLIGNNELGAPIAITGGVAEALIATAFGLGVAIIALVPFNILNAKLEGARQELQDAATHVELFAAKLNAEALGGEKE